MHQNTLFRTEWLGYILEDGEPSSITTKSLQHSAWSQVGMASCWFLLGAGLRLASGWACTRFSAQCHPVLHEEGWTLVTCHSNTTDPGQLRHRLLLPVPPQKQKCKWGRGISTALGNPAVKANRAMVPGPGHMVLWSTAQEPGISPGSNKAVSAQSCIWVGRPRTAWATRRWALKEPSWMCAPRTHNPPFLPKAHSWKQAASTQLFSLTHDSSFRYAAS